jgi:predicted RNA methylase
MAKIYLDKYYTDKALAKHCIDTALSKLQGVTEIIEPSAGNGSFSLQIPNCIAYDIAPEHDTIIQQDFLSLGLEYKKGRLIIGNPPFGTSNTMSVKFFKKAITLGDYVAFILPISQHNNNQQMFEFDLIHSEVLPTICYSGRELNCCFNIYQRPEKGVNKTRETYSLKDVTVFGWRRGGSYKVPTRYDFGLCGWGAALGKEIKHQGQYAQEFYIAVNSPKFKEVVVDCIKNAKWQEVFKNIATPKLSIWSINKYIRDNVPGIE